MNPGKGLLLLLSMLLLAACGAKSAPAQSSASQPGAASAPSSAAAAASGSLIRLAVANSSTGATNLPSWVGRDNGIYDKNGLDIDWKLVQGGSTTTSSLLGGDVQIVMGGGSEALAAAAGGADLVIAGITVPTYTFLLEVPAGVKTPADLKGKSLAVPAQRGTVDIATRVALKSLGLEPDKDVSIKAFGSLNAANAAILSGAVDGGAVNPPENVALEAKGLHPLLNLATAGLPAASNSIYTLRSYAASHRDVVQKYVDGVVQSIARVNSDRNATALAIKRNLKLDDQKAIDAAVDFYQNGVFPLYPYAKPENFKDAQQLIGQDNPQVLNFDVSKILDSSFVKSAEDRGVGKS
jgi:ABC-type nitrate/sulfonate/bicarbonate transport system substrate-binding protein